MALMDMIPPEARAALEAAAAQDADGDAGLAALADPGLGLPLKPLTAGEWPAFLRAARPILSHMAERRLMDALLDDPEALIAATAIGARVERAWLEAQTLDVLVEHVVAVVESNGDFFVRRLAPVLIQAAERLTALFAGLTSTPDS